MSIRAHLWIKEGCLITIIYILLKTNARICKRHILYTINASVISLLANATIFSTIGESSSHWRVSLVTEYNNTDGFASYHRLSTSPIYQLSLRMTQVHKWRCTTDIVLSASKHKFYLVYINYILDFLGTPKEPHLACLESIDATSCCWSST